MVKNLVTITNRYGTDGRREGRGSEMLRVAAYCRVSTDLEEQKTSFEGQIETYSRMIEATPNWVCAGIYADEGVSGTTAARRREFMKMIAACEEGKIDLIITKSISRFARNTLECLDFVRRLGAMGVNVFFESVNVDTREACSEMLLTVLAAFAQEESRSISENTIWGVRKRYAMGVARWSRLYGYAKIAGEEYRIEPEEAKVSRLIFDRYERGATIAEIQRELERRGIASPRGKSRWSRSTIQSTLSNERYVGDVLLQKYRVENHITHRTRRNDSTDEPPRLLENHHPPIVTRKQFDRVQEIRAMRRMRRRDGKSECNQYPFGAKLRCPYCGAALYQRSTPVLPRRATAWSCDRDENSCRRFLIRSSSVESALLEAYAKLDVDEVKRRIGLPKFADAAKRTLAVKEQFPRFVRVDYWWVDELIERVDFVEQRRSANRVLKVRWRCGVVANVLVDEGSESRSLTGERGR